jgi:hypothetical protein
VLAIRSIPILLLLVLPTLQLLATLGAWRWVRLRVFPHVWIRGYSPFKSLTTPLPGLVEVNHRPLDR